jgi:hypothetical protein
MPLPGDITTIVLTGTYLAADGSALAGQVSFAPSSVLTDTAGEVILGQFPLPARLQPGTGSFSVALPCTDNAGLSPAGWMWQAVIQVPGSFGHFWFLLPSTLGDTADISSVTPATEPPPPGSVFVSSVNGQSGAVTVSAGHFTQGFTSLSTVTVAHDLGRFPAITVIDTADDVCVGDVRYLDANTVQLSFSAPFSGTAICT